MWKLFPSSWFKQSDLASRRQAMAVETLEKNWRVWLEAALERIVPEREQPASAFASLTARSGADLLAIDEALRYGHWTQHDGRPERGRAFLVPIQADRNEAEAYLFVASCNSNGFLREQALIAFAHYPGSLALAAALIRCDDWVPQVQSAAVALLKTVLSSSLKTGVVRYIDLVWRLKSRKRFSGELWASEIQPQLFAAKSREGLWSAARDPRQTPEVRQFAYELLKEAEPARLDEVFRSAIGDAHPLVAIWGLEGAQACLSGESQRGLFELALVHPHSAVRQKAIRAAVAAGSAGVRDTLLRALFDRSRGPRRLAAYELDRLFGERALPYWRGAVDGPMDRRSRTAILALCEFGEREDVERLAEGLQNQTAGIRIEVVRALWRVDSTTLEPRLKQALNDPSKEVVRQAVEIFRRGRVTLEVETLEQALLAANDRTQSVLLGAAHILGKWQALAFLLRQLASGQGNASDLALAEIARWSQRVNRNFTSASAALKEELPALLVAAQRGRPDLDLRSLEQVLRAL